MRPHLLSPKMRLLLQIPLRVEVTSGGQMPRRLGILPREETRKGKEYPYLTERLYVQVT